MTCTIFAGSPVKVQRGCPRKGHSQARDSALRHGNNGIESGEKVKTVVSQPHAETEGHQAVSSIALSSEAVTRDCRPICARPMRPRPSSSTGSRIRNAAKIIPSTGASV